jgi:hypothetical protein
MAHWGQAGYTEAADQLRGPSQLLLCRADIFVTKMPSACCRSPLLSPRCASHLSTADETKKDLA